MSSGNSSLWSIYDMLRRLECHKNLKADLCHLSRLKTRFHQSIFKSLAPEMSASALKIDTRRYKKKNTPKRYEERAEFNGMNYCIFNQLSIWVKLCRTHLWCGCCWDKILRLIYEKNRLNRTIDGKEITKKDRLKKWEKQIKAKNRRKTVNCLNKTHCKHINIKTC